MNEWKFAYYYMAHKIKNIHNKTLHVHSAKNGYLVIITFHEPHWVISEQLFYWSF